MKNETWELAKQMINKDAAYDFDFSRADCFRAKAKDNDWKWHYGYLLQEEKPRSYLRKIISRETSWWNGDTFESNTETIVIPETVCMSSGIRDKKSNLIYDGDILELSNFDLRNETVVGYVFFRKGCFWLKLEGEEHAQFLYSYDTDFLEVVGNIFDELNSQQMFGG